MAPASGGGRAGRFTTCGSSRSAAGPGRFPPRPRWASGPAPRGCAARRPAAGRAIRTASARAASPTPSTAGRTAALPSGGGGCGGERRHDVDAPEAVGAAWGQALAADRPFVIEAITDPEVPPLPPSIRAEHAKGFASSLRGDPAAREMVTQAIKGKAQELLNR